MRGSHQLQVFVTGLSVPNGLAFDDAGNLYITNTNTVSPTAINNTVSVFPEHNGTLFGVPVRRHVLTTVFSDLSTPMGLAFDHGGNLYVANVQNGTVSVLPKASGTLFGVAVTKNTPATVVSALSTPQCLAFDQAGNLYITSFLGNTVSVLPKASGTLFGKSVTENALATLVSGLDRPGGLASTTPAISILPTSPQPPARTSTEQSRSSPRPAARSSGSRSLKTPRPP